MIEDWIKVSVLVDERGPWKIEGYYRTEAQAKRANHTGWYGAAPHFDKIKVAKIGGTWFELVAFKPNLLSEKETISLKELEDALVDLGAGRYFYQGTDGRFIGDGVTIGLGQVDDKIVYHLYVTNFNINDIKGAFGHLKNVIIHKTHSFEIN